ncbi:hypothetical protein [Kribbella sp. NPDC023855]|uniref:hypothetical protein n=1 Tax=Kribbella sp. NPDC023855 TaxID=3154698 RepID=UPI0033F56A38
MTRRLLDEFAERNDSADARHRLTAVTGRELRVLKAVGRACRTPRSAANSACGRPPSRRTSAALAKLGLTNRVQAALLIRVARLS